MSTYAPRGTRLHRPHVNPWLVAVVALTAALLALGGWVLFGETSSTQGLASDEVASMLSDRIDALNSGGELDMSGFYAADAVLEEHDVSPAVVTTGGVAIADRIEGMSRLWGLAGIRSASESDVIQFGPYAAEAASIGESWEGILIYRLDEDGRIVHQWVIGP